MSEIKIEDILTPLYPEGKAEKTVEIDDDCNPEWLDEVRYPKEDMPDWTLVSSEEYERRRM